MVSDVDGTLVTNDKTLTPRAIRAVQALHDADVVFALTSARPPQGLRRFIEPLKLTTPLSALNGGLVVDHEMDVITECPLSGDLAISVIDTLTTHGMSVWVYRGTQWLVLDENGPHVQHESRTSNVAPTTVKSFDNLQHDVLKIVGVSDDTAVSATANSALGEQFTGRVNFTLSQSYYLDVTHPDANKGSAVRFLAALYGIPIEQIATIGDMPNDISMFQNSAMSIAMGNAAASVKAAATHVTTPNDDEGFARAMEEFILLR
jgi:Cof subfamily protein (haloacid dehalogenase superfamily)